MMPQHTLNFDFCASASGYMHSAGFNLAEVGDDDDNNDEQQQQHSGPATVSHSSR